MSGTDSHYAPSAVHVGSREDSSPLRSPAHHKSGTDSSYAAIRQSKVSSGEPLRWTQIGTRLSLRYPLLPTPTCTHSSPCSCKGARALFRTSPNGVSITTRPDVGICCVVVLVSGIPG
eukprot:879237-Rhodomonas_salina.3